MPNLDPRFLKPFVVAIPKTCQTMLKEKVQIEISEEDKGPFNFDVSGVIGLTGDINGAVAVRFPFDAAEKVVSAFAGMPVTRDDDEIFCDAVGEIANIVAGSAKADMTGYSINITVPSVIVGESHRLARNKEDMYCVIRCKSSFGPWAVEVSFKPIVAAAKAA